MTTWLEFRSESMSSASEVEEYIGVYEWSANCTASDCNWSQTGERSCEDWMTDMHEIISEHKQWHEDGMPQ